MEPLEVIVSSKFNFAHMPIREKNYNGNLHGHSAKMTVITRIIFEGREVEGQSLSFLTAVEESMHGNSNELKSFYEQLIGDMVVIYATEVLNGSTLISGDCSRSGAENIVMKVLKANRLKCIELNKGSEISGIEGYIFDLLTLACASYPHVEVRDVRVETYDDIKEV